MNYLNSNYIYIYSYLHYYPKRWFYCFIILFSKLLLYVSFRNSIKFTNYTCTNSINYIIVDFYLNYKYIYIYAYTHTHTHIYIYIYIELYMLAYIVNRSYWFAIWPVDTEHIVDSVYVYTYTHMYVCMYALLF